MSTTVPSDSTRPLLITQKDWPAWYEFIRRQAKLAEIWDYVDPGKDTVKTNTEPVLPTATDPTQTLSYDLYKIQRLEYVRIQEKLQTFGELIIATVGSNFSGFLKGCTTPHEFLTNLKDVAKPSQATLRQMIRDDMVKRSEGPKRQSIEAWLQLHITIIQRAKDLDSPLAGADEESIIRAFVEDCEEICPLLYTTYGHQVLTDPKDMKITKLISEFNLLYKPAHHHTHAATISGLPTEASPVSETRCYACGLLHRVWNCKQLFKPLRESNFVANDKALEKCDEWLKVPANRRFYERRLKELENETKSSTSNQDNIEDLSKPRTTVAAIVASSHGHTNLSLQNSWGYDTMADTHICNDIKQFRNFTPTSETATAGDTGMKICGYGDILLAIEVGKQRLIRQLMLKNVAYTPDSHINLVCAAKLRKVGVIIDQATNHLRYKDDNSLFANLTERSDLYIIDATVIPPAVPPAVLASAPTVTVHAVSTKRQFRTTGSTVHKRNHLTIQETPDPPVLPDAPSPPDVLPSKSRSEERRVG